jgi:hypothetical protein
MERNSQPSSTRISFVRNLFGLSFALPDFWHAYYHKFRLLSTILFTGSLSPYPRWKVSGAGMVANFPRGSREREGQQKWLGRVVSQKKLDSDAIQEILLIKINY